MLIPDREAIKWPAIVQGWTSSESMPLILGTSRDDDSPEDGLGALSIREVVESALEQEDIMPVVSYFQTVQRYTYSIPK